ncbi:MAG: response regulator transcription factor [Cellulosilyticaceae bacterium]
MKTILLVEDDEAIAIGLRFVLEKEQFKVLWADTLTQAKVYLEEEIDLIVLDLNLPDGSGYSLCEEVRAQSRIPIIFLTVRDDEDDMIRGLDLGADDYITKPFKVRVLLSRIQAVLRRVTSVPKDNKLRCGELSIDPDAMSVSIGKVPVLLTKNEYKLLELLMVNKGQVVTRERILDYLWGIDGVFVSDNTLTVMMKRLREKLRGERMQSSLIQTLRGVGYRMEASDET